MEKYYIGIDLGGTNIKGAIFNKKLNLIYEQRSLTEADKGSEHVLNRIYNLFDSMLKNAGLKNEDIVCMDMYFME